MNLENLLTKGNLTAENLISSAIILIFGVIVVKFLMRLVRRLVERIPVEKSLHSFICSIIRVVFYFILILIIGSHLGIDMTSLIAIFSVFGLAVSLSVQNSLSNLAGGLMVLVSKPFIVGDYIEAGGVEGSVKQIGLVYTQMVTVDNKVIYVPNSEISSSKIINFTREDRRRVELKITASYENSIDQVKSSMLKSVKQIPVFLQDPEPFVNVSAYQSSSIEYVIRVWTKTEDYWTGYYELLEEIKRSFDRDGIEMTYDHINVHMMKN